MTPILYEKDEIDFTSQGLGALVEIYDVDVAEQRNGLLQLTASYPVSGVRYADISVGRIILAKPNQRDDVHAFRIVSTELDISGYAVRVEADSITYDLTHNLVKHLVVSGNGQSFMTALKNAVVNPSIFAFYSDIATSSTTLLNYVNPMEAIMGTTGSFLQIWGGELKRENRRVAMFNRRGRDNVATFRLGKNISGLKYSVDISSLVTRIIPTKSVQNDDKTTTTLEGTPVDSQYINNYEQIYTLPLEFTDDTIKTVADLNAAAKGWFTKSANTGRDKPTVTIDIDVLSLQDSADYQDKFKNLESVSLTDTVTVYVPEYGVNVTAIVNELHYDPILDRVTKMTVGTAKQSFADSSRTQLSDLQDKIISVQNQADATAVSANGKNKNYYGSVQPSHPQEGDQWYWQDGDKSGIKQFVNGDWVDLVDSDTQEKIAAGVTEAISQANTHTATAIVQNNASQQVVMNDIAKSQANLAIKNGDFNNKAQAMADKALADAKANTTQVAQDTLNSANQNIADAKKSVTDDIAQEASDRASAVNALDTKAQGYVDAAKNDINDTINALSVGGRNYLLNSNGSTLDKWTPVNGWSIISDADRGNVFTFTPTTNWTGWNTNSLSQTRTDFPTNKAVTVSFWAKASVDGAKFHSEPTGGNATENSLFNTTLTTAWKRYSYTFVLKTNRVYFMPVDAGTIYYLDDLQLETGNMMSDYKQAPEDVVLDYTTKDNEIKTAISQYQTTNDGKVSKVQTDVTTALGQVATKVSQTDYNTKTGQLQTDLTTTTQTANQAKTDIISIKQTDTSQDSRMNTIESDANGTKQTVSQLQTAQGKQSGYISTLQQRADGFDATVTKVDNLSIGGRNYFLNSSGSSLDKWVNNSNFWSITTDSIKGNVFTSNPTVAWTSGVQNGLYQGGLDALKDQQVTVSFWAKADKANANFHSEPSGGAVKFNPKLTTSWAKYSYTIPNLATTTVYFMSVDVGTNYYLDNLKIESGNTATDWSPAPEDVDSATAKAQLTADNASAAVTKLTNADGIITKAQADIRANADAITKKVSKTVYDQKTGDLTEAVSKAQSTADGAVSTVGNYKTGNDKRVESAESKIEQNSKDITARVIKTDYDDFKESYKSTMSEISSTFDRITSTVSETQNSINDLQQVNLLKNTEFNPDYASWVPNDNSGSVFIDNFWKHGSSNNIGLVRNNGATNWLHVVQNIPLTKNQVISFSVLGKVNTIYDGAIYLHVRAYDKTNKSLGDLYKITQSQTNGFQTFKSENMTLPDGTAYVQVALGMYKNASVAFSQPILVIGNKVGSYVVGSYSDSEKISAQQITIDGITNIVSDPKTGLSTRVQTAEGTLSTVKSTADGAMSKASQTANDISQEIEDRKTGDTNTLQSSKDFTQSSITSSETEMKSVISQTADGIMAKVDTKTDSDTVLSLLKDNWSIGISDNIDNITSGIVGNSSSMSLISKNIVLDGNTTVTGDFYAKGGNFKNLNASNLTVGTLNGSQVNITNINANNIVSGAISGANLNINLNTGQVQFQKGRINSSDYTTDINIDQGYISTANDNTRALIKQGMIQLVAPNRFDLDSSPYMELSNNRGQRTAGAAIVGRDSVSIANSKNSKNIFPAPIGTETFSGLYTGQAFDGGWLPTKVAGADRGVVVAGGTETTWQVVNSSPYIRVGTDAGGSYSYGNRVVVKAEYLHATTVYNHYASGGGNVYISSDGALLKSSSATKYKTNIEHETDSIQGDQLLTIDPATWNDKFESEQLERYHEIGVEPERQINMEGKRYYGIIAEDLVKAGLEELVTRNEETDEVEGVEYSKIGVALIPIVRDLRNKLNEQAVEIERLKDKNK
ncbi:phage tail spike protein [Leuconostoc mesenteroides]|uniref:phage tail spike protein n=1 Tax=Leuconostoc mesenteroides TaxID=1245 RepID=UPI003887DAF8